MKKFTTAFFNQGGLILQNICLHITPYEDNGEWFFDNIKLNIFKEGLTCGTPEVIKKLYQIQNKKNTTIVFSDKPVAKYCLKLIGPERDGSAYHWEEQNMKCWFCPTLLRYFKKPPQKIWFEAISKKIN